MSSFSCSTMLDSPQGSFLSVNRSSNSSKCRSRSSGSTSSNGSRCSSRSANASRGSNTTRESNASRSSTSISKNSSKISSRSNASRSNSSRSGSVSGTLMPYEAPENISEFTVDGYDPTSIFREIIVGTSFERDNDMVQHLNNVSDNFMKILQTQEGRKLQYSVEAISRKVQDERSFVDIVKIIFALVKRFASNAMVQFGIFLGLCGFLLALVAHGPASLAGGVTAGFMRMLYRGIFGSAVPFILGGANQVIQNFMSSNEPFSEAVRKSSTSSCGGAKRKSTSSCGGTRRKSSRSDCPLQNGACAIVDAIFGN